MRPCLYCGTRRPEKGGREREYCNAVCRQLAYRQRHRWKHNLNQSLRAARLRMINSMDQNIHRETWQDELERASKRLEQQKQEIAYLKNETDYLHLQLQMRDDWINTLTNRIAEKEAEIARLQVLLDRPAKQRSGKVGMNAGQNGEQSREDQSRGRNQEADQKGPKKPE